MTRVLDVLAWPELRLENLRASAESLTDSGKASNARVVILDVRGGPPEPKSCLQKVKRSDQGSQIPQVALTRTRGRMRLAFAFGPLPKVGSCPVGPEPCIDPPPAPLCRGDGFLAKQVSTSGFSSALLLRT